VLSESPRALELEGFCLRTLLYTEEMKFLVFLIFFFPFALAGNEAGTPAAPGQSVPPSLSSDQVNVVPQRQGIASFEYDPDEGGFKLTMLEPSGDKKLAVDTVEAFAIGDELERGRTIKSELTRLDASTYRGTLNLSEGTWNLIVRVKIGETTLKGQYALGVGKSLVTGKLPLVPPNPEVNRLTNLMGWLFGIPIGLAVLLTVGVVILKQLRPAPRAKA
jgi:hypothetical protein